MCLIADHLRSRQSGPTTSSNSIIDGQGELAQNLVQTAMLRDDMGEMEREPIIASVRRFGTMPGAWQDPQLYLRSCVSRRSAHAYHDIVDLMGRDTMEETVVAGMHEGGQIIIKPKLESLTLPQ